MHVYFRNNSYFITLNVGCEALGFIFTNQLLYACLLRPFQILKYDKDSFLLYLYFLLRGESIVATEFQCLLSVTLGSDYRRVKVFIINYHFQAYHTKTKL